MSPSVTGEGLPFEREPESGRNFERYQVQRCLKDGGREMERLQSECLEIASEFFPVSTVLYGEISMHRRQDHCMVAGRKPVNKL
jgi:hypothetical protein